MKIEGREQSRLELVALPTVDGRRGLDRFSVALIKGASSFAELFDAFQQVGAGQVANGRSFVTLDDLNQCLNTSGHAANEHGFGDDLDYPDDDDAEAVDAYEAALFEATGRALRDLGRMVAWEQLRGELTTSETDIDALSDLNRQPDLLLDDAHVVQCLPGRHHDDLLANIPNGYFSVDWNPFQLRAVVKRICERHNYVLFGIGASTLGFVRQLDSTTDQDVPALVEDLKHLYGQQESSAWQRLEATLATSPILILGYTEDFAHLVE